MVNLTFHGIGPPPRQLSAAEEHVWVSTQQFTAMLDLIQGRDGVQLTFDDGNVTDMEIALPALAERGMKGIFFVLAGRLGSSGFLSAQDMRSLHVAGMTVGSHGMHHRPWRGLREKELQEDIVASKSMLEQVLGCRIARAACPFGSYGRRSLQLLRATGYERVFTSDRGPAKAEAWLQPRNTICRSDDVRTVESLFASPSLCTRVVRGAKLLVKRWR